MRRSLLLQVNVYCPHFQRTVSAMQNEAVGRLVSCSDGERCRADVVPVVSSGEVHERS